MTEAERRQLIRQWFDLPMPRVSASVLAVGIVAFLAALVLGVGALAGVGLIIFSFEAWRYYNAAAAYRKRPSIEEMLQWLPQDFDTVTKRPLSKFGLNSNELVLETGSAEGDIRMTPKEPTVIGIRTLADRLSEGKMPASEALRYARLLGEALREVHGSGKVHGALSPESVVLTGAGIELSPASEKLESYTANVSADIYGFGAVLYEMLTGRKVISGGDASVPEPTGIPAADRLIAGCLAKEPPARLLSMQKALLELKLATVAARRAEVPAVARRDAADAALRAEMQQLEARLAARLEEDEKSVAERLQTASALHALRTEFVALKAELAAAEQGVQADAARHTALEHRIDTLEAKLAADVQKFETDIKAQAAVTESVRASLAQADDLVERVVDAMETIQDSILD